MGYKIKNSQSKFSTNWYFKACEVECANFTSALCSFLKDLGKNKKMNDANKSIIMHLIEMK